MFSVLVPYELSFLLLTNFPVFQLPNVFPCFFKTALYLYKVFFSISKTHNSRKGTKRVGTKKRGIHL
ncbi:hypothetical protein I7I48_09025 [Histoplasma ohiense]|nr:hypothetical protein I7I48_09025 [Histoplasma ohiense (nom. inval.)]